MERAKTIAVKITVTYIVIGVVWILLSDALSIVFSEGNLTLYIFYQRYKGWLFIMITGVVLYFMVQKRTHRLVGFADELQYKEQQLLDSKQHYKSLFANNPDGVFEFNHQGEVVNLNPAAEEILGYRSYEVEGLDLLRLIADDDVPKLDKYFREAVKGRSSKFEAKLNWKKGNKILRCSLVPIIVQNEVTGVFVIARDITQQLKDEELMISNEKQSIIGQLAAAIAHEIRNPLTSLKGFVQLMQTTKNVENEHLEIMESEIERINEITTEMLILGKKQDLPYKQENLFEIVRQVLILMNAQANLNNVTIQFEPKTEKELIIYGEANHLKQVFINIIKNAVEAISGKVNGTIVVEVTKNRNEAIVAVKDNGVGMDAERIQHLGEPYFSTKERGTGLGLTVTKKIIERHKGSIQFKSRKDIGTEVTIRLPLLKVETIGTDRKD